MRILVVHNRYMEPGGEDAVVEAEAALLRRLGHDVHVFLEDNARLRDRPRWRAAIEALWSEQARRALFALLKRLRPDVVHVHNTFLRLSPSVYYACREAGVPVVQTLHNYRLLCPAATFYRAGRLCTACLGKTLPWPGAWHGCWRGSRAASAVVVSMLVLHRALGTWTHLVDRYIVLSRFAWDLFRAGGFPEAKLRIKPNFVYPDPGPGTHEGKFALFVGRLSPEKGAHLLPDLARQLPHVPLLIAGDGPLATTLQRRVADLRLTHVHFLGRLPKAQVLRLMQTAQVLVFPSLWYEGFPMTLAEALATGLPVVAFRLGAVAEILGEGQAGILVPPGDIKAMAEAVAYLWTHPQAQREQSRAARRAFESRYTAERNAARLLAIYQEAIETRT